MPVAKDSPGIYIKSPGFQIMLHLICTLEPVRISWLSQFVEHYRRLGIEAFHLSLQVEPDVHSDVVERWRSQANRAIAPYGYELASVLQQPFSSIVLREHHDALQDRFCSNGDWIVWS